MSDEDRAHRWSHRLIYVPLLLSLFATAFFLLQGGFGGGHGDYDGVILTLMFPGILIVVSLSLPAEVLHYDYLLLIAMPGLLKTAMMWLIRKLLLRLRKSR